MLSGRVDREEEREREQVHADQDQHRVADAADDVAAARQRASLASRRPAVSRSRRLQPRNAGITATTSASAIADRPPDRPVPLGDLRRAQRRIDLHVHQPVVDERARLDVADPLVIDRSCIRVVAERPRRVVLRDRDHAVHDLLLARAVVEVLQFVEQLVELGVAVVGRVLAVAVGHRLRVRAVQQEQEVLGVRVVGEPAPPEDLQRALLGLLLEAVVVGGADLELHADLRELAGHPLDLGFQFRRQHALVVVVEHQRPAGLGVAPVRGSRLRRAGASLPRSACASACHRRRRRRCG